MPMSESSEVVPVAPVAAKLEPGWYLSTDGVTKRWWNGDIWTDHKQTPPGWFPHPTMVGTQRYWDGEKWTENIAPGAPTSVVVNVGSRGHKTSHGFHLIMSLITVGLWIPVWIIVGISNASRHD